LQFRGHSDTEVLLAAWQVWGPEKACQSFIGMFAFALWDKQEQTLFLVRDRLGVKPLYWGRHGHTVFFGSTLKNFFPHPHFSPVIDLQALSGFVHLSYVPGVQSIFQDISKVPPGTILAIKNPYHCQSMPFWSFPLFPAYRTESLSILQEELEDIIYQAVQCRLLSDVPLGAFLSGGIDSSLVTAFMQRASPGAVQTFSIGFHEKNFDEAFYARKVAQHLGTHHHELYVSAAEALALVPQMAQWYDEPFADSSQIPTYLVCQLARQHVTVALSGDGGDEAFAGYNRYLFAMGFFNAINKIPLNCRKFFSQWGLKIPISFWDFLRLPARKISLALSLLPETQSTFYQRLLTLWSNDCVVRDQPFIFPCDDASRWQKNDLLRSLQIADSLSYLPDDILTKVDRASMAMGLEVRGPFLDHRLIEFAQKLPIEAKIHGGKTKYLLRKILHKYVPPELIERPKMGFGIPLAQWLRGPLNEWAGDLLSEQALDEHGFFHKQPIIARWHAHNAGQQNYEASLWAILMFQSWYAHYKDCLSQCHHRTAA
jgi:asparagine synthase (glutamine-hydrolysing)